jgi:hypothetical protein
MPGSNRLDLLLAPSDVAQEMRGLVDLVLLPGLAQSLLDVGV